MAAGTYFKRNQQMHPRNIYCDPPDFKQLATTYTNLLPFMKISLSGKASYDFKNAVALAELTKTLLLRDFDLTVNIPSTTLVPTVPLRLNYILWVEDLLTAISHLEKNEIHGIDIGTGASCVYSLLAAKKGWKMLATEVNKTSAQLAEENVTRNELSNFITIKTVDDHTSILCNVIDESVTYHFCMCNPPFFSETEIPKNRTKRRRSPSNGHTGSNGELRVNGGELEFIKKMMTDSLILRDKIAIYSTMVGKKDDYVAAKKIIKSAGIRSMTTTEFHQGKVIRWAIAWSFDVQLPPAQSTKHRKAKCRDSSISFFVDGKIDAIENIKKHLSNLQMAVEVEKADPFTCNVAAFQNTWANQRRKRRQMSRAKEDLESSPESKKKCHDYLGCEEMEADKKFNGYPNGDIIESTTVSTNKIPVLEFRLTVSAHDQAQSLEFSLRSGALGKSGLHEIAQYFKNILGTINT